MIVVALAIPVLWLLALIVMSGLLRVLASDEVIDEWAERIFDR